MSQQEGNVFFFLRSTALLIGHKKWIQLGSILVKTRKCANHKNFVIRRKDSFCGKFASSSNVILQRICFNPSDAIMDSTIPYYVSPSRYLTFCSQNNIVYYVLRHKTLWLTVSQKLHDQERNLLMLKWTDNFFEWCLPPENGLLALHRKKTRIFCKLHWWLH